VEKGGENLSGKKFIMFSETGGKGSKKKLDYGEQMGKRGGLKKQNLPSKKRK